MGEPELPPHIDALLVCPDCRHRLSGISCQRCNVTFASDGDVDLRPRRVHDEVVRVRLGEPLALPDIAELETRPDGLRLSGADLPAHVTPALVSHLPTSGGTLLDLGCGDGIHRGLAERAGFSYVGVDYGRSGADLLADAHRLPFDDESFEVVFSVAVFEHLRWPLLAASEVARVLRPGGTFVGTVAFAEPFHSSSYYHHTHLGIANDLQHAGLTVFRLAPAPGWVGLRAHAKNALFPGMPTRLRTAMVAPVLALHRAWYALARRRRPELTEIYRLTKTTGAWTFVATKPA